MRIKKIGTAPIPSVDGAVVDSLSGSSTTNAPSVRAVNEAIHDTGWLNLTLNSGFTCDSAKYRKIGKIVYVQIVSIGGVNGYPKNVATLPVGFRPSVSFGTGGHATWDTYRGIGASGGNNWVRWEISSHTGVITINAGSTPNNTWCDVNTSFVTDE